MDSAVAVGQRGSQPMMATEAIPPEPLPRPVPGQDGTFDLGDTHADRVRRWKVRAHLTAHYNLLPGGVLDCPYCGGLV